MSLYTKLQKEKMSKYEALALDILTNKFMTTNKIRRLLEKKMKTKVNWYILHHALTKLERDGKVEMIEGDRLFLWKLREKER